MEKLRFEARTLDDNIVKDGLCAVGALEDDSSSRGLSFVVGGVATQSYLPTTCRRPTSDIDLAILRPLNYTDFKKFSEKAVEYLRSKGYTVELKKRHVVYHLIYSENSERGAAVIEFPRKNRANFERNGNILKREITHTRKKIVEGRNVTYTVSSPEDIVVPKIVRGIGSLGRYPDFCRYIEGSEPIPISSDRVMQCLEKIGELRIEAMINLGNAEMAERLRFVSDILDIALLSNVAGFNEKYLKDVMGPWDTIKENTAAGDLLVNYLLPDMVR